MTYKILLIDDDQVSIDTTLGEFENETDLAFTAALNPEAGRDLVKRSPDDFAVVLLDYNFPGPMKAPGTNGAEVAKILLSINNKLNIVILSGDPTQAAAINTYRAGAVDFIDKNAPAAEKVAIVRSYCQKFDELSRVLDVRQFDSEFAQSLAKDGLIGKSKAISNLHDQIHRIKESASTVLIQGESGTGKELVARAIHNNSIRRGRPFIAINCGALPEKLIESELFGHEKGAFTDAITKKIGKFQLAHGGTIFLDEIGDMPLDMQVKLLRVLQEGTIDPVGSRETIRVNVRVIAATNVNIEEAVKNKKFREDLFYRLNVIPIYVPALRDRREDIEILVAHFVRNHPFGSEKKFLGNTLKYFQDYSWNGNVRELENTVDQLLTLISDDYISPQHLHPKFFKNKMAGFNFDCDWKTFLEQKKQRESDQERKFLIYHLSKCRSIRELASTTLKMPNTSLQVRIKELEIDVKEILKGREDDQDIA